MANGAFNFKDNSGNVVSFISGSGSDIIMYGGTLDLSGMTGLTLGNLTMEGTVETASFAPSYLLTSSFNSYTGTTDNIIGSLQTSTSSLNSFTSSADSRLDTIEGVTGSYATTGSNTFNGNLTVTGYIDAQELRTTYISSSILYRSGSTKFGDELTDIHAFTGSMLLSGSLITTGNIGVGTNDPLSKFHVNTGTNQNFRVRPGTDVGAANGIALNSRTDDDGSLQQLTLRASDVIMLTSGGVGIGTSDPQSVLNNFSTSARGLAISNSYPFLGLNDTDGGNFYIGTQGNLAYLWNGGTDAMIFATNNTERMRITSDGNVLVGSTNADVGGSVKGAIIRQNGSIVGATNISSPFHYQSPIAADRMNTQGDGLMYGMWRGGIFQAGIGATNGSVMTFFTGNNDSMTERMRITSDGVVRINGFTSNGLVGTDSSGNLGVVNLTYTEIATGTISYSMNSGAPWGINNSFPATIRDYNDDGMAGSGGVATNLNLNRGVTFDLGSAKAVRKIVERGYGTKNLDTIQVQYSTDNSNWTTIHTYRHVYGNTQKDMEFNPTGAISARYWRWLIDGWTEREVQNYYTYESIIYT